MPATKSTLAADTTGVRLQMGELGYIGLNISNGKIYEEARAELRYPASMKTYFDMSNDATIASALSLFEMMMSRVEWTVETKKDANQTTKDRAAFVASCMTDMEHSWFSFIKEVTSCYTYGFSVHEKVFRKRLKSNGSRFNDGKYGLRKLPIRAQSTISKWLFDPMGRNMTHCVQDLRLVPDTGRYTGLLAKYPNGELPLERNKFLHFRTDVSRDNPEGKSPLSKVFSSYKYMMELKEQEAIGITR